MKERIVLGIKERILSEYAKHKNLDWAEIAARKIYASYQISLILNQDKPEPLEGNKDSENKICGHIRGSIVVVEGTAYAKCKNCGKLY